MDFFLGIERYQGPTGVDYRIGHIYLGKRVGSRDDSNPEM
jgi:hypothetical protein